PGRQLIPLIGHRTFMEPIDHSLPIVVSGLITYYIQPVFIFVGFADPGTASGMLGHDAGMFHIAKNAPADGFPSLLKAIRVLTITSQKPDHMVATIAGYHILCKEDGLRIG